MTCTVGINLQSNAVYWDYLDTSDVHEAVVIELVGDEDM